jgi:hypothetical protein
MNWEGSVHFLLRHSYDSQGDKHRFILYYC